MIISNLSYLEDVSEISNIMRGGVNVNCTTSIVGEKASIVCNTVTGGEVRVRADCKFFPDLYSEWFSKPGGAVTGDCPWGIRGAITETRSS